MRSACKLLAWPWVVIAILAMILGCSSPARRTITGSTASSTGEPVLSSNVGGSSSTGVGTGSESAVAVIEPGAEPAVLTPAPPSTQPVGFVDRHPLLRKPQQYYDNTNSNKLVKTASATFVGVPAGIIGELRQIVVGKPSATSY